MSAASKLPFSWQEKVFFAVTSLIGIYEVVFWLLLDYPLTVHDKKKTPMVTLAVSAAINSVPHLLCGTYGLLHITRSYKSAFQLLFAKYKHNRELKAARSKKAPDDVLDELRTKHKQECDALPVYQKGGLRYCVYVLYICLFVSMQVYFWWLPYFFGIVTNERFKRMQSRLTNVVSLLPANDKYLVPSLEHTILFPLSLIAWILAWRLFLTYRAVIITQVRTVWINYGVLVTFSVLVCYLPASMAFIRLRAADAKEEESEKNGSDQDYGAAIVGAVMTLQALMFFVGLCYTPKYTRVKQRHVKTE